MCDHHGGMNPGHLKSFDVSRRSLLKATATTALTMAIGPGLLGGDAHAASAIKSTHGTGFCNLNIFLSHALQTAKDDGLELTGWLYRQRRLTAPNSPTTSAPSTTSPLASSVLRSPPLPIPAAWADRHSSLQAPRGICRVCGSLQLEHHLVGLLETHSFIQRPSRRACME